MNIFIVMLCSGYMYVWSTLLGYTIPQRVNKYQNILKYIAS